jgi:PAS domain S-box-containing protein
MAKKGEAQELQYLLADRLQEKAAQVITEAKKKIEQSLPLSSISPFIDVQAYVEGLIKLWREGDEAPLRKLMHETAISHGEEGLPLAVAFESVTLWKEVFVNVLEKEVHHDPALLLHLYRSLDAAFVLMLRHYVAAFAQGQKEKAEEQERYLATITNDLTDAILTLDQDDIVRSWNRGAEATFGYQAEEIVGKPLALLVPPHLISSGEVEFIHQRVRERGSLRDYETELITKAGKTVLVSLTCTLLDKGAGKAIDSSVIIRDITAQQSFRHQLWQSEKLAALGTMAAGLAHEVGNPLNSIFSLAQLIERRTREEETKKRLALLKEQVARISRIVRQMADFTHSSDTRQSVQVNDIIQAALALGKYSFQAKQAEVVTHLDPSLPAVPAMGDKLLQVFLNVILNAYDAMNSGGILTVTSTCVNGQVQVSFADTGPGIAEAIRNKIFEPFFTTKEVGKGTGLGLAVSHNIITELGGRIVVENRPQGGALFTVVLPVAER